MKAILNFLRHVMQNQHKEAAKLCCLDNLETQRSLGFIQADHTETKKQSEKALGQLRQRLSKREEQ